MNHSQSTPNQTQQKISGRLWFPRNRALLFLEIVIILTTIFVLLYLSFFIQKVAVVYSGDEGSLRQTAVLKGKFLYTEDEVIRNLISEANVQYKVEEVRRIFPGKLELEVRKSPIVAFINFRNRYIVLTEDAKIVGIVDSPPKAVGELKLPSQFLTNQIRIGENFSDKEIVFATNVAAIFFENSISAFRVNIVDQNLIECDLPVSGTIIKLTSKSNKDITLSRLNDFIQKLYTTGKNISVLDLRFDKAIIQEK